MPDCGAEFAISNESNRDIFILRTFSSAFERREPMESRAERYRLLKHSLDNNPGFKYRCRMQLHDRSLHIFLGNFADLKRTLDFVEDPNNVSNVWAEEKRNEQIFFHREIVRHFHNFLSAARSLVEHTRVFMNDAYAGQSLHDSYTGEVEKRFANDPLARFMQDLRNYFLHKGVPTSTMKLSFNVDTGAPPASRVLLQARDLRSWKRWSPKGKEYLDNTPNEFSLREVIEVYHAKVVEFYDWFQRELDDAHKEELASYEDLRRKIAEFHRM